LLTSSYPILIWKIDKQSMISLDGEVAIQYSVDFKKVFGFDVFIIDYVNNVMGHIPSGTILKEGSYEEELFQIVYEMSAKGG
jgi:neutral ceramidase